MAIGFRASATADHDGASGTTFVPSKPAGVVSGDYMLAWVEAIGTSLTVSSAPSGWTLIQSETGNANILSVLYAKVAGGSEPSSYTWTLSNSVKGRVTISAYTGVDNTTPIDATAHGTASLNVTTAPPAVTATLTGDWLVYSAFGRHSFAGAAQSFSTSGGSDSLRHGHGSNAGAGFDVTHAVWDSNTTVSSGALSRTVTASGTENAIAWHAVALKSAAGTPTARVYQSMLNAPQAAPALRGRVYQSYLVAGAPSGGKTARVYQSYLVAPLASGHPGPSGMYILAGGAWHEMAVYVCANGAFQ
jgi:hypothetical protein